MRNDRIRHICIYPGTSLFEVLKVHSDAVKHQLPAGIALVVDENDMLVGTVTDGDVRRAILKIGAIDGVTASDAMTRNPIVFPEMFSFKDILEGLPGELKKRHRRANRFLSKIILVNEAGNPVDVLDYHQLWEQRVASHRHVVVIGLGYVGITLALVLAERGFLVTGVDVNPNVVDGLNRKQSHVHEIGLEELLREQVGRNFSASTDVPADGDVFIIAVGTPVQDSTENQHPSPTMEYLKAATVAVGERLSRGNLVVLRSTVPPGTTREFVMPLLEEISGLRCGPDFHLSFAPERTIEGNAINELYSLPQVIGGINEDSVEATTALFRDVTKNIIKVESLEAAEMVKLINNCYRDLIFAFANELTQIGSAYNLDLVEVIRAANQGYPRDTVPLPSPGVGGPCLTKDPYILMHAARTRGQNAVLSMQGRMVNESMHSFVADSVINELQRCGKNPLECSILVCGLAFKGSPETTDLRGSSSVDIGQTLVPQVGQVYAHDPVVSPEEIEAAGFTPVAIPESFGTMDAVLFLNNHRSYRQLDVFEMVRSLRSPAIVYDGWHLFRPEDVTSIPGAIYMGLGMTRRSTLGESN